MLQCNNCMKQFDMSERNDAPSCPGREFVYSLLGASMSILAGITLLAFTHQLFNNIINSVFSFQMRNIL